MGLDQNRGFDIIRCMKPTDPIREGRRFPKFLWLPIPFLLAVTANASPITTFVSQQSFFNAVNVISTEGFDEFPSGALLGVGTLRLNGIVYTSAASTARWITNNSFTAPSPPNTLVQENTVVPATLTLDGGGAATGLGFFLVGLGGIPIVAFRIDVAGAD